MSNKGKEGVEVVVFSKRKGKKGLGRVVIEGKEEAVSKRKGRKGLGRVVMEKEESASKDPQEFDFRKARHDVFKFGVSGLDTASRLDAKIAHAVRLGARPPKNKYVNYKVLMAERRREKEKEVLDKNEGRDRFSSTSITTSKKVQKKKKKNINDVPGLEYQVGKYRSGVQEVTKQDLMRK